MIHWKIWPKGYQPFFDLAQAVMVSSPTLLEHVPVANKFLYRTTLDQESFTLLSQRNRKSEQPFAVGWLSGSSHGMDEFVAKLLAILDNSLSAGEKLIFHQSTPDSINSVMQSN